MKTFKLNPLIRKYKISLLLFAVVIFTIVGVKAQQAETGYADQSKFYLAIDEATDKDSAELIRLHEQQKTAHLTNNAELFVEMFNDPITQIQNGNIAVISKEKSLARFTAYFATMKFQEWSDIAPPVVKISKDGTLATMTVNKRVRATYKNEQGEEEVDHSIFAWLTVWEKIDGKWKVITIASTAKYGKDDK